MAAVVNLAQHNPTLSYLNAYHCFGRSLTNADTLVNFPEISRTHAVVEWKNAQWFIRDISQNGTWLNAQKLQKDKSYRLNVGDKLNLGGVNCHGFEIKDLTQPQHMLVAVEPNSTNAQAIPLSEHNLLPNDEAPEVALFYVPAKQQWYKEYIDDSDGSAYLVKNHELICFAGQSWQLQLNVLSEATITLNKPALSAEQMKYRFHLSQDEESAEFNISTAEHNYPFGEKAHHYLTATLARKRSDDIKQGEAVANQGWIARELLAMQLGIDISTLNTQICRARKQYSKAFANIGLDHELIERRGKNIRFVGGNFRIYKGSNLEVAHGRADPMLTVLHG